MLVATQNRVYRIDTHSDPIEPDPLIDGVRVRSLEAGQTVSVVCLDTEIELLREDGRERLSSGIDEAIECLAILCESPLRLLLGTEDARIYRYDEDNGNFQRLRSFDQLACRSDWYTPWGGPPAVRSLATNGAWVFADIHVGSIMRSPDLGESWEPVVPDLHEDVHQVETSPTMPERVYANTADAVYVSYDRGNSWAHRASGLASRYGRAIAVDPFQPDRLLATVSRGPHSPAEGRLYRTEDAGQSWSHVTGGFPSVTDDNIDTFQLAFEADGTAWAVVGKDLFVSGNAGLTWRVASRFDEPIFRIAATGREVI